MISRITRYGNTNAAAVPIASIASSGATMFSLTAKVCTLRIGIRLTTSSETPTIQAMMMLSAVVRRPPLARHCILAAERADGADRARRCRHPDEVLLGVGGQVGVQQRVEAGQAQHNAHRVEQHHRSSRGGNATAAASTR